MGQVLHGSATTTEAVRRAIQHSQESLRTLASALRHQPEDRRQVETAHLGRRSADRTEGAPIHRPVARGRGHHRRLPQAHAAAARRLPVCPAGDHPASNAVLAASLPAATRHRPPAGRSRANKPAKKKLQGLSDRLLPHRHRRSADRGRQALPVCRHRPHQQIRLRPAGQ